MKVEALHPSLFSYNLPEDRIAKHPLPDRTASKLLHYRKGEISHLNFESLPTLVPYKSTLVFNNSRVIPARLILQKSTGAAIEIFLLEPLRPNHILEKAMECRVTATWKCMIGNARKWKVGQHLEKMLSDKLILICTRISDNEVTFHWGEDYSFSEVISLLGTTPLPPYIKRQPNPTDTIRYQTIYSEEQGAVAAPTAGLHFSKKMMAEIGKNHPLEYVTLHVSAGTFQPITDTVGNHKMHREQLVIHKKTIESLLHADPVLAIGTTSLRTLESLYWYGVLLAEGNTGFHINKLLPYQNKTDLTPYQSLETVLDYMQQEDLDNLIGHTELFIVPGYRFQLCKGLVTNFHMPGSTLLMLIAAFVGEDWKKIYQEALKHQYRFLSYGDASLLLPG